CQRCMVTSSFRTTLLISRQ
ncbi:transporter, anaerobic C4-dicarboxylate uptake family protein, partial [Vibrio parahaemolyticus AQ3810]